MELNSTYLNKSYYVATLLQYGDELKREGFAVQTRKKMFLGLESFVVDLWAEKDEDKRIYEFRATAGSGTARGNLEDLADSAGARLITVHVRPPMDRRIAFEDLGEIFREYFAGETPPPELETALPGASFGEVRVEDIVSVSIEKDRITLEGRAAMTVRLLTEDVQREFPLWFCAQLDADHNPRSLDYELDVSGLPTQADSGGEATEKNKTYISKTRFENEFAIMQELSEKVLTMLDSIQGLFGTAHGGSAQTALGACTAAEKAVNRYAAFIPAPLYEMLEQLMEECGNRTELQRKLSIEDDPKTIQDLEKQTESSTRRIRELRGKTTATMRAYVGSLDVKD